MAATKHRQNHAFATLITRASYLAGVVMLAHTLKVQGSKYPLVIFYTPTLADHARCALELEAHKSNVILRKCDALHPPSNIKTQLIAERFGDTWTKLRVFELVEFDVVCYLDADMMVFRNPDAIFDRITGLPTGWLVANHSCVCNVDRDPWASDDWRAENCAYNAVSHPGALEMPAQPSQDSRRTFQLLNGGMFLFRPSADSWNDMLDVFNTTPLLSTFKFPDQEFLAYYFKDRWSATGWCYNALKTMRYWHQNIWRDEEVVILHYVVDKPWAKRLGDDGKAGYLGRDYETHKWWWDAYERWETERSNSGDTRVLDLIRKGVAQTQPRDEVDSDSDMRAIGSAVQAFANREAPTTLTPNHERAE